MEHAQQRRQRDRVHVVSEAERNDLFDAHFDIVAGQRAQAGRQDTHQPVKDDFQHRQTFVRYEAGTDNPLHAVLAILGDGVVV